MTFIVLQVEWEMAKEEEEVNGDEHYQTFYMQNKLTITRKKVHWCKVHRAKKDVEKDDALLGLGQTIANSFEGSCLQ